MKRFVAVSMRNIGLTLLAVLVATTWVFKLGDRCAWFHIKRKWWPAPADSNPYGFVHCGPWGGVAAEIVAYVILAMLLVAFGYLVGRIDDRRPRITAALIIAVAFLIQIVGTAFALFGETALFSIHSWQDLLKRLALLAFLSCAAALGVFGAWLEGRRRAPVTSV